MVGEAVARVDHPQAAREVGVPAPADGRLARDDRRRVVLQALAGHQVCQLCDFCSDWVEPNGCSCYGLGYAHPAATIYAPAQLAFTDPFLAGTGCS